MIDHFMAELDNGRVIASLRLASSKKSLLETLSKDKFLQGWGTQIGDMEEVTLLADEARRLYELEGLAGHLHPDDLKLCCLIFLLGRSVQKASSLIRQITAEDKIEFPWSVVVASYFDKEMPSTATSDTSASAPYKQITELEAVVA